jgi:hypothetical protein
MRPVFAAATFGGPRGGGVMWPCAGVFFGVVHSRANWLERPDLNLPTPARSQGRIDIIIRFFPFEGDVVGLSVAICYGASKIHAPTRNLATYHRILFVMAFCCDYISEQNLEPNLPLR